MKNLIFLTFFLFFVQLGTAQTSDTLIAVDGYKLHFNIVKGEGTPILFESGNGDAGSVWQPLLSEIHMTTRSPLITYDRAGLGESEIDTVNITFEKEIKDLRKALVKLGFDKDYFLVAHSFGGFYASLFSYGNENKIKGAVFIDIGTPCYVNKEFTTDYRNSLTAEVWQMLKQKRLGLYYVLKKFPEISEYMSTRYISNSVPLTLIVADHLPDSNTAKTAQDKINWVKCLEKFGNLPNHKYVATKNTDHRVWEKDPKTVIDEITSLYMKVKR